MANEKRLRIPSLSLVQLDTTLADDGTTLTVAKDARLSAITSANHLALISEAGEILYATAYDDSGADGVLTVARAQETAFGGGTATENAAGHVYRHGPTLVEFPPIPTPIVRLTHSSPQSLTSTLTAIAWNTAGVDPYGFWDSGANTRATVPAGQGGAYLATFNYGTVSSTNAFRIIAELRVDGGAVAPQGFGYKSGTAEFSVYAQVALPLYLTPGQYVQGFASINTGTQSAASAFCGLSLVRIGA